MRLVTQQPFGFADVGQRVGNIARTVGTVNGLDVPDFGVVFRQKFFEVIHQLIQRGLLAAGRVVNPVDGFGVRGFHRQQVHPDDVVDIGEVAAVGAVAIDNGRFVAHELFHEQRDDGGVGAVGILPAAEDVEIAQPDGFHPVDVGEDVGIEFVDVFGDGVGRQRFTDAVFHFGKGGAVAIGGRAGGVDETFRAGIATGNQHVEESRDVHLVGGEGIVDGAGHRAEGRFVKHVFGTFYCFAAIVQFADIAHDKRQSVAVGFDQRQQVFDFSRGEVVQHRHVVSPFQQLFRQVRADKSRPAGHQYFIPIHI